MVKNNSYFPIKNSKMRPAMKDKKITPDTSVFLRLGMTEQQTKVYLVLSELEQAAVQTIAMTAQMDRAEVYRVIPKLRKLGIVKKIVSSPVAFRAIPPSEALSILLESSAERHQENYRQAKQFLRNFANHEGEKPSPIADQYILTSGQKAEMREFLKNIEGLQTGTDGIFEWNNFLYVFKTYFEEYKRLLEKGVKIRRAINKPENVKIPRFIQTLRKTGSFEIKITSRVPKSGIDIWDGKLACIITVPNSGRKEMEVLRSRNPTMLALAQDYFEIKWQTATPC